MTQTDAPRPAPLADAVRLTPSEQEVMRDAEKLLLAGYEHKINQGQPILSGLVSIINRLSIPAAPPATPPASDVGPMDAEREKLREFASEVLDIFSLTADMEERRMIDNVADKFLPTAAPPQRADELKEIQ